MINTFTSSAISRLFLFLLELEIKKFFLSAYRCLKGCFSRPYYSNGGQGKGGRKYKLIVLNGWLIC